MEELSRLELNNKSLDEFDKLMNCHLDKIEELEINEININAKLYNLISLCTNLKQLIIKGDLRSDVNKIFFNICNPENIDTIILEAVKLPTNKVVSKFTNLSTLSLNNIQFSDLVGFFNKIPNPEKIIALNLTDVDFGKRPISICSKFENLKYLNFNNLKNCVFDSFEFIYENKNLSRFEFCNNEIEFKNINTLLKGKYNKKIELLIETTENCEITNALEINDNEINLTVNTCDLEKAIDNISFYKLSKLCIILGNNTEISQYIKKFKKIKGKVILAIKDINYFNIEDAKKFRDRLDVQFVNVLESPEELKLTDDVQLFSIDDYIEIREEFEKVKEEKISNHSDEIEIFNELYNYLKNEIKYTDEKTDLKDVLINKKASHNYYALIANSLLKELNFDSKVIKGKIGEYDETYFWNQVKINDDWYNFDIAYELKPKSGKKFLQNMFKCNLLNDDQFYKTHTPYLYCKPKLCDSVIQEVKRELKKEKKENKISLWKKICQKYVSIFKFNKEKALPEPGSKKEE